MSKNKFIRRKNDSIKTILIILILLIGVGYAYISTNLNINGTANINSASWNVHWANVQVSQGSVSANTPTITNQTTVNYTVTLTQPGDYYEFTVDAVNSGTIDAMIDTINSKLNGVTITTLPAYLEYSVAYSDGAELQPNQQLLHNTIETYKVRIGYKSDINSSQLPSSNQVLSLQFTVTYRQATDQSQIVNHPYDLYRSNINIVNIGDSVSALGTTYPTYQDLTSTTGVRYFLRHRIVNNQVGQSDVGFIYNNNVYFLISGGATYNQSTGKYNSDSIYYEANKETLLGAYGSSKCTEAIGYSGYLEYRCSSAGSDFADVIVNGSVGIVGNGWACSVYGDGNSYCTGD